VTALWRACVWVLGLLVAVVTIAQSQGRAAPADTERFALLVAHHDGGEGLARLRYAERDATRLADVLVELGGFSRGDLLVAVDADADVVRNSLDELERRVAEAKARGSAVVAVVYYSGHAENGVLRLGPTRLPMDEVRRRLEASAADIRLAFIDSCGAGQMVTTREKGATVGAPFVVKVDEGLSTRGQVIIASSSASEVSQESDEIQGSFFTHHLTTGLRGDADRDGDGRVTLDEAYAYAYGRTVAATASTRAGPQHPTYAFDLKGTGDVVLTRPAAAPLVVEFPAPLQGRYFVVDLDRQLFVAEVDKAKGGTSRVALPAGQYAVKKRLEDHLLLGRLPTRQKGTFVVDDAALSRVAFSDDYAKGSPIVEDRIDRAVGFSFSAGAGVATFLDPGAAPGRGVGNEGLFVTMPLFALELRARNLFTSPVFGLSLTPALDLGFGSVAAERVIFDETFGDLRFPVQATQIQGGLTLLSPWSLAELTGLEVTLSVGPRLGTLLIWQQFQGASPLPPQNFLTFVPGAVGVVAWSPISFAHLEVAGRAHYLPYTVDTVRHLAVVEVFASVWLNL
jgi:hypothetical protein